jgi:putative spermidine/putrescine transport system permease protein
MFLRFCNLVLVAAVFLFLLGPVILVFPISFSADSIIGWPPSGWSLRWYEALLDERALIASLGNSLILAAVVGIISIVTGMMAAMALVRHRFAGRDLIMTFLTAPLLLPTIVLAFAMLVVFASQGWIGRWHGLILGHLLVTIPYTVRILATTLSTLPPNVEVAAASLGARPLVVTWRITMPLMARGMIAAGALAFLVSFDEVVISLFIVGPQLTTFPVALFRMVEERADPMVAAASVILIIATLLIAVTLERIVGLRRAMGGETGK